MIPETNPYNNWSGNGSVTTFDFDFYIEDETQLVVYHTDSDGVQTTLTLDEDYSINETGNENGSYITFPLSGSSYDVLGDDEVISLCLALPISQENEYGKSSYLNLETVEYSFDYITRILQIMNRYIERCVKVQEGTSDSAEEYFDNFLEEVEETIADAKTELASEVSAQIAEYKEDTDAQIAEFEETVNTSISNMETEISEFETSVNTSISEFKEEVETEVTEFEDTTNTTVETFKADITNMLTEVIDAAESIETLYESIETTAEAASEAAAQAAAAQEAAESLTSALEQVETNTTNISELEERLTTDETAIETNASDIAALQENAASNTSVIDTLDSTYLPLAGNSYDTNPITGSIHFASSAGGRKLVTYDSGLDSTGTISNPNGTSSTYFLTDCSARAGTGLGWLGGYELYIDTSDVVTSSIGARNRVDGTSYTCTIRAMVDTDGTCYTYAPTPSNNDDSTKIATTAFVSNMLTSSNSNFITFSKSSSGYYKFANGLLIQWGRGSSVSYSTTASITFPTSFSSSTSYKVIATTYNTTGSGDQMNIHITAQTSTTFSAYVYRIESTASGTRYLQWIAIGY